MAYVMDDRDTLAQAVVDSMVTNGQSLRKCCIQIGIDPARFLRAVDASPELAKQYARARQALLDKMADEILELADAPVPVLDNGCRSTLENGSCPSSPRRCTATGWMCP